MRNSTSEANARCCDVQANRSLTVCVVDAHASDYRSWQQSATDDGVRLRILTSADEALRLARTERVHLWVVNTDLPVCSGFDLCRMLKAMSERNTVFLVADHYSPQAEQEAWRSRATLFGCKPTHDAWLDAWLAMRSTPSSQSVS